MRFLIPINPQTHNPGSPKRQLWAQHALGKCKQSVLDSILGSEQEEEGAADQENLLQSLR